MTQIYAHRGSAGTHPENTMLSFQEALKSGADGIEMDVHLTKDGHLVIIHDETIDRTTTGKGIVREMTLKEIQTYDASHKFSADYGRTSIPSLEEFFSWMRDTTLLCNIELKNGGYRYPGMEEKLIGMIKSFGFEKRMILSSFNHYSLVHCYSLAPEIEIAPLYSNGLYMPWVYAKALRAAAIHPSIKTINDEIVLESMNAGVAVRPYTVNTDGQIRKLFALNCSAIITDFPERAVKLRNTYKQ
ncbi:glycerophosphodiester phosphodiesterase [Peribacillus kribbensis]|uniref:glycerophosphodiester phosphodiesterase n=1 Tax=Peribacillus kribbensis TaxID=356658 RepID=UPI000420BEA2|nr:glycerophosphodiester phosphodiesterase [Peribacillus kribbensis]